MHTDPGRFAAIADRLHTRCLQASWGEALTPEQIDRAADIELQAGHHRAAERLAWLAAGMREGGV